MRLHKLRYREQLSKKVFLELLRDDVKVTHEDNERLRAHSLRFSLISRSHLTIS